MVKYDTWLFYIFLLTNLYVIWEHYFFLYAHAHKQIQNIH